MHHNPKHNPLRNHHNSTTNRSQKRTRDPEATKNALLDAAEEVFLEKGFGDSSISQIAKRAGITKSLIHHYFGSKAGLWQAVKVRRFEEYFQQQMQMFESSKTSDKLDLLRESMVVYFRFLQRNPQMIRILAWMFLERDQDMCLDKDKILIDIGVQQLRKGQEQGLVRSDVDPRFIVFILIGLGHHWFQDRNHFIHDFGIQDLPEDLDSAYLDAITKIFFEGILPR